MALLRSIGARWLVTKNTGRAGGLLQKLSAAEEAGAKVLLIERPAQEPQGYTLEQLCRMLAGAPLQQARRTVSRFPLFVEIQNRPCLVVGGGNVGKRRAGVLQEFGAQVTVVEPEAAALPDGVRVLRRGYQKGDADGMALVVAATGSRRVNAGVARECAEKNIPVSVADCPEESSFYFPAICQSEELTAGIVSQKKNHTLVAQCAGAVRRMMKEAGW